tara:strand:+ start:9 stop:1190 length:1182 start_codon:yes stop_codon:yes gene_type:complete
MNKRNIFIFRAIIYSSLIFVWTSIFLSFMRNRPEPYYSSFRNIYLRLRNKDLKANIQNNKNKYNQVDFIDLENKEDFIKKRAELNKFIYGERREQKEHIVNIKDNITDSKFNEKIFVNGINKLTFIRNNGINSIAYHFKAKNSINKLLVFHEGIRGNYLKKNQLGNFVVSKRQIKFFLSKGYDVLAISLPTLGLNPKPIVNIKNIGKVKIDAPYKISLIDQDDGSHFLRYFIEPVSELLDFTLTHNKFDDVAMIGIGSGGWVTTLAAASDLRIKKSFSVSGTLPIALLNKDFGKSNANYFEYVPSFYLRFNYLDLYLLSAHGINRSHNQIYIINDPRRFSGEAYKLYADDLKKMAKNLPNTEFDFYKDSSTFENNISKESLEFIYQKLLNTEN